MQIIVHMHILCGYLHHVYIYMCAWCTFASHAYIFLRDRRAATQFIDGVLSYSCIWDFMLPIRAIDV